jgi:DNA-binding beta-propeller fold protein YncE
MRGWLIGMALLMLGCSTQSDRQQGLGRIYLSNRGAASIARFEGATRLQGELQPKATLRGALTRINQPGRLFFQREPRRLFVPSGADNSVLIFDNVHIAAENVPPTRFLSGIGTQLNRPIQVVPDTSRDLLYVANAGSNSVLIFSNAATLQGAVAPVRQLSGGLTRISSISAIHLDIENDRLWVVDPVANSLLVYPGASTLNGNVPPARVISGSNTQLNAPQYLLFQGNRLWISNTGSLLRFDEGVNASGNQAPSAVVSGQITSLVRPQQMALDADNNELYVVDSGAAGVLVFSNPATIIGNVPPRRRLQGNLTGLVDPIGLILDLEEAP